MGVLKIDACATAKLGLGTQPLYEAPGDLQVEYVKRSDKHRVSEAASSIMTQSWPWGSHIAVKKILQGSRGILQKHVKTDLTK